MVVENMELYSFRHLSLFQSTLACISMALLYVISLYLWSHDNRYNRNLHKVIKRRFLSVFSTSIACLFLVYSISKTENTKYGHSFNRLIGLRFDLETFIYVTTIPLFLTMVLFAGPILQAVFIQPNSIRLDFLKDIVWWRNIIVSPLTEEFVFRSCMIPLLINNLGLKLTIFLTPLTFSLAHIHHIIESICNNERNNLKIIILEHLFQLFYTYLFGLYSSFLFARCANLLPCFACHAFCNYMGFPNVGEVFYNKELSKFKRNFIIIAYFAGLISFVLLIGPLTEPNIYDNRIFY